MNRLRFGHQGLCVVALLILVLRLSGQVTEIDKLINFGKYSAALPLVNKKFSEKKSAEWRLKLAICYYHTNQLAEAQKNLLYLSDSNYSNAEVALYLGKIAHQNGKFNEAISHYKLFLRSVKSSHPMKRSVVLDIKRCATGMKLPSTKNLCVVDNLGSAVNSVHDELAPIPSPSNANKIYFSTNRPEVIGGLRDKQGLVDELYGSYCSDIFSAYIVDGEWNNPEPLGNFLNSPRIDRLLDISAEGNLLYYFKGFTFDSGEVLVDTFKIGTAERPLVPSKLVAPIFPAQGEVYLQLYNTSFILFSSQRMGGYGGYDLYWTEFRDSSWSDPMNLGPEVNSYYDELCPFLAVDGRTLFFSRNSDESMGGFDIFKAKFVDPMVQWSKPVNVGLPVNSPGDDLYFRLSRDGQQAFLSSNRKDGFGGFDLYDVIYREQQHEQLQLSSPLIFNAITSAALTDSSTTANVASVDAAAKVFEFSSIYYDKEEQTINAAAKQKLNNIAKFWKEFPEAIVRLSCHSDESLSPALDLYFGIKRAEKYAAYLIENGVPQHKIEISSSGSNYPIAENFKDGQPNSVGRNMNQRIDIAINNLKEGFPVKLLFGDPLVSNEMRTSKYAEYQSVVQGLHYRIQIASITQMYKGNIVGRKDAYLDKDVSNGNYRYYVGLFSSFYDASKLLEQAHEMDLKEAIIVPFFNGARMDKDLMISLKSTFPDLLQYLNFYKIK